MRFTKMFVAVLVVLCMTPLSMAGDSTPPREPYQKTESSKVKRAIINAMIDPPGSFTITYWAEDFSSQCPINPNHTITVRLLPNIDGTYINNGCPHEGPVPCFCDIYVRTNDTKQAWERALTPYQQDYTATLPIDPSPDAKVQSSTLTYSTMTLNWEATKNTVVVDLSARNALNVTRGDEFKFTVDAFVPAGAESPCADPAGRPCRLTTELWQVSPDGSRKLLRDQFEIGDMGTVWLSSGTPAHVSLKGIFPHPKSYQHIPKGKAALVGTWFLMKNRASLLDYQVPVGKFEVPLNIQ